MKKSLLALGVACVATCGMAATPNLQNAPSNLKFNAFSTSVPSNDIVISRPATDMKKAPAKLGQPEDIIYDPQGRRQNITLTASGFFMQYGLSYQLYRDQNVATHMVYGDNNEVYIYDIIPFTDFNSYVKGVKDGDKIVVELPQTIHYDEDEWREAVNVAVLKWDKIEYDGQLMDYWVYDSDVDSLTFNIEEDGTIRADIEGDQMLGLTFASDNWYASYGVYELSMVDFNEVMTELPEGFGVVEDWFWYNYGDYGYTVGWAPGGDVTYFKGLSQGLPDSYVKCTASEDDPNVLRIAQDQYIGIFSGYYMWTKCAKFEFNANGEPTAATLMPEDYEYEIVWDPATATYLPKDKDVYLLINGSKDQVWYMDAFWDFKLIHQTDFSGTPKDPYGIRMFNMMDITGYNNLQVMVPCVSTENNLLNPDDLYYMVYLDEEPWVFEPDEYDTEEPIVEIPWTLDLFHIYIPVEFPAMREVDIFVEGFTSVGVQSVYRYNGVETRSNIVTVKFENPGAVDAMESGRNVADVKYFDLSGREVETPAAGIFVKRVTFDDGTVATYKKAVR